MEDRKMNSKEFTELVGISLKTLERMEKNGEITPIREGRTRYYYLEQVKQFEESKGKFILGVDIERNITVTVAYNKDVNSEIIKLLEYCLDHNIHIDESKHIKAKDIKIDIGEIIEVCRDPRIVKLIYSGKESLFPLIKDECEQHGILAVMVNKTKEQRKKCWFRRWLDGRRQKK